MAKKVKAKFNFVGTAKEVEDFGGGTPEHLADREHKLTNEDKRSFAGKITAGTELTVSDKRAKELEENGLVEVLGDAEGGDSDLEGAQGLTNEPKEKVMASEKVQKEAVQEKNDKAGPNTTKEAPAKKAATKKAAAKK